MLCSRNPTTRRCAESGKEAEGRPTKTSTTVEPVTQGPYRGPPDQILILTLNLTLN